MQIRGRDTARAHVGGLRVPRPRRSTYPDGNPRTAGDVYMRRGLLLVVDEKCHRRASGKRGEVIITVYRRDGTLATMEMPLVSRIDSDFILKRRNFDDKSRCRRKKNSETVNRRN